MLREVGHESTGQSIGRNIKFFNVEIPCCNNIPLAKTKMPYVLQRSIIRLAYKG